MKQDSLFRYIYSAAATTTVKFENLLGEFNDEQSELVCRWIAIVCHQVVCHEKGLSDDEAVDMLERVRGFDINLKRTLEMARGKEIKPRRTNDNPV